MSPVWTITSDIALGDFIGNFSVRSQGLQVELRRHLLSGFEWFAHSDGITPCSVIKSAPLPDMPQGYGGPLVCRCDFVAASIRPLLSGNTSDLSGRRSRAVSVLRVPGGVALPI